MGNRKLNFCGYIHNRNNDILEIVHEPDISHNIFEGCTQFFLKKRYYFNHLLN